MSAWYTPGASIAVVGERLVALVGPGASRATIDALWETATTGGGVHEALVAICEDGLEPSFALLTLSRAGLLHAALRGDVEAVIGSGMRGVRAGEATEWTEVTAHDVAGVTLRAVGGEPGHQGAPLPLLAGAVQAAEVRVTAEPLTGAVGTAAEPGWVPADDPGLTIVSGDLAKLRAAGAVPAGPPQAPPRPPLATAVARIELSTGLVVPLDRTVLLGRAPQAGRLAASDLPRLVTVPSPQQDVSRTHAKVHQEGEHVLVTDLESLNGTRVLRPGGPPARLHPGEPTVLAPGDVVDVGDGVTFRVSP